MKFGKILRQTVDTRMPHWRDHMLGYKELKRAIKRQLAQGTHGSRAEDVAAAFTALLDQHVEVVNDFYMERIEEGVIILHALQQHGDKIRDGGVRPEFAVMCQRSLVALHFQLLLLQNYVALNFTAVTKILKKFEKNFAIPMRNDYIGAIVDLPFYRCDALGELVEESERQFNGLAMHGGGAEGAAAGAMRAPTSMPPPPPRQPASACADAVMNPAPQPMLSQVS